MADDLMPSSQADGAYEQLASASAGSGVDVDATNAHMEELFGLVLGETPESSSTVPINPNTNLNTLINAVKSVDSAGGMYDVLLDGKGGKSTKSAKGGGRSSGGAAPAARSAYGSPEVPPEQTLQEVDLDGDGLVSEQELRNSAATGNTQAERVVAEIDQNGGFVQFDDNADGALDSAELASALAKVSGVNPADVAPEPVELEPVFSPFTNGVFGNRF